MYQRMEIMYEKYKESACNLKSKLIENLIS